MSSIKWLAKYTDLSISKKFYRLLKNIFNKYQNVASNAKELETCAFNEWQKIPQHKIKSLYKSTMASQCKKSYKLKRLSNWLLVTCSWSEYFVTWVAMTCFFFENCKSVADLRNPCTHWVTLLQVLFGHYISYLHVGGSMRSKPKKLGAYLELSSCGRWEKAWSRHIKIVIILR